MYDPEDDDELEDEEHEYFRYQMRATWIAILVAVILAVLLMPIISEYMQGPAGTFTYKGNLVGMKYESGYLNSVFLTLNPAGDRESYMVDDPGYGKLNLGDTLTIVCTVGPYDYPKLFRTGSCVLTQVEKFK